MNGFGQLPANFEKFAIFGLFWPYLSQKWPKMAVFGRFCPFWGLYSLFWMVLRVFMGAKPIFEHFGPQFWHFWPLWALLGPFWGSQTLGLWGGPGGSQGGPGSKKIFRTQNTFFEVLSRKKAFLAKKIFFDPPTSYPLGPQAPWGDLEKFRPPGPEKNNNFEFSRNPSKIIEKWSAT